MWSNSLLKYMRSFLFFLWTRLSDTHEWSSSACLFTTPRNFSTVICCHDEEELSSSSNRADTSFRTWTVKATWFSACIGRRNSYRLFQKKNLIKLFWFRVKTHWFFRCLSVQMMREVHLDVFCSIPLSAVCSVIYLHHTTHLYLWHTSNATTHSQNLSHHLLQQIQWGVTELFEFVIQPSAAQRESCAGQRHERTRKDKSVEHFSRSCKCPYRNKLSYCCD